MGRLEGIISEVAYLSLIIKETPPTWLSRTDKEERDRRNARIKDMWLRCYSQQEIGEAEGLSRDSITDIMGEFSDLKKLPKSDLAHAAVCSGTQAEAAGPLATHKEAGAKGGKGNKAVDNVKSFGGNDSSYLCRRLLRDHKEIFR